MELKWKRKNGTGFTFSTCGRYWFCEPQKSGEQKGKRRLFGLAENGYNRVFIGEFTLAVSCKLHAGIYHDAAVAGNTASARGLRSA